MSDLVRTLSVFLCGVLLAACGGGGGSGGGGGGGGNGGGGSSDPDNTISLDRTRVDLLAPGLVGGEDAAEIEVTFSGAGLVVGTLPGTELPSWLFVGAPTEVNATTARVRITFLPGSIQPMTPQRVSTTLRFATADADGDNIALRDLQITGTIDHELSRANELFTYTLGATATPSTTIDLTTANADWSASTDADWLTVTPASGTGNAALTLSTTPGTLPEGDYVATLSVRDTLTNRTRTTTVQLGVDPRRLEVDRRGIALSSTLGRSRTHANVRIIDTAGLAGRWRLSDDAAWLAASATEGAGDTEITLEAHAAGLDDGMYYATVTVEPDDEPGLANPATVRVGFFVDGSTPVLNPLPLAGDTPFAAVADPVRPLIYGLVNHSPPGVTLNAWNVHTGALVHSLTIPGASYVSRARVSPDGSQLLLFASGQGQFFPVALSDGTPEVGAPWTGMRLETSVDDFAYARINGADVILWSPGQILSAANGSVLTNIMLPQPVATYPSSIAVSPNGQRLVVSGKTNANHSLVYVALGYRAGVFSAPVLAEFTEPNDGEMVYFDPDGTHVVSRSSGALTRYTFGQTVPEVTLPMGGYDLFPSAYGGFYVTGDSGTNWIHYSAELEPIADIPLAPFSQKLLMAISGDETRLFFRDLSQVDFFGGLEDLGF